MKVLSQALVKTEPVRVEVKFRRCGFTDKKGYIYTTCIFQSDGVCEGCGSILGEKNDSPFADRKETAEEVEKGLENLL